MKITILGASGQIGSVIYDGLKNGHDVVGTSRKDSPKYIQFDPFQDDWRTLGRPDVLINCVGQIESKKSSSFYKIHVDLTKLIIKNREVIANPRVIQISALGASAGHNVEFLKTKGTADNFLVQHAGTVVVRPSIVCTHRTIIVKKMLMLLRIAQYTRGLVLVPKGFLRTRIQPVMPQDLIDVVRASLIDDDLPQIINVVGPDRLSFLEIITNMFETRRKKFRAIEIPKIIADIVVMCGVSVLVPAIINSQQYQLLFEDNLADTKELEKALQRKLISPRQFFINEFRYAAH